MLLLSPGTLHYMTACETPGCFGKRVEDALCLLAFSTSSQPFHRSNSESRATLVCNASKQKLILQRHSKGKTAPAAHWYSVSFCQSLVVKYGKQLGRLEKAL
jgi:hypothetical protein